MIINSDENNIQLSIYGVHIANFIGPKFIINDVSWELLLTNADQILNDSLFCLFFFKYFW